MKKAIDDMVEIVGLDFAADFDEKSLGKARGALNNLSADEHFLMMLKEKCSTTDAEWEERQKTRQLEMEACSKALAFISSDDAHDLFTKTFNLAFVQKESRSERRTEVLLKPVATFPDPFRCGDSILVL